MRLPFSKNVVHVIFFVHLLLTCFLANKTRNINNKVYRLEKQLACKHPTNPIPTNPIPTNPTLTKPILTNPIPTNPESTELDGYYAMTSDDNPIDYFMHIKGNEITGREKCNSFNLTFTRKDNRMQFSPIRITKAYCDASDMVGVFTGEKQFTFTDTDFKALQFGDTVFEEIIDATPKYVETSGGFWGLVLHTRNGDVNAVAPAEIIKSLLKVQSMQTIQLYGVKYLEMAGIHMWGKYIKVKAFKIHGPGRARVR